MIKSIGGQTSAGKPFPSVLEGLQQSATSIERDTPEVLACLDTLDKVIELAFSNFLRLRERIAPVMVVGPTGEDQKVVSTCKTQLGQRLQGHALKLSKLCEELETTHARVEL